LLFWFYKESQKGHSEFYYLAYKTLSRTQRYISGSEGTSLGFTGDELIQFIKDERMRMDREKEKREDKRKRADEERKRQGKEFERAEKEHLEKQRD